MTLLAEQMKALMRAAAQLAAAVADTGYALRGNGGNGGSAECLTWKLHNLTHTTDAQHFARALRMEK